jgi:HEAT repeat protein
MRVLLRACVLFTLTLVAACYARAQDDAIALIVQLLGDKDKDVRAIALDQVRREAAGEAATLKFAELLPTLPADAQVGLLSALAGRGDKAAAPAVRSILTDATDEAVRVAATQALGSLGSGDDVPVLVKALASGPKPEQAAARASLVRLSGEAASAAIVEEMQRGPTPQRIALIEILATRRTGIPELLKAAIDEDAAIRTAGMIALGEIGTPDQLAGMLQGVLKAKPGKERTAAERAVAAVCHRLPDNTDRAKPLIAAFDALSPKDRLTPLLLPTLGRVGGPEALIIVERALADSDFDMHSAGLAALCNWPDGAVAARLLELARTEEHAEHRKQALKALIRVAPLSDARSDSRRLDLVRTIFVMCQDDTERNLVLQRAKSIRTMATLRYVAAFLDDPKFDQQACETVVELAHHRGLREPNKGEFDPLLDRVVAISKDATVVDRAQRYKKGETWNRPKPAETP